MKSGPAKSAAIPSNLKRATRQNDDRILGHTVGEEAGNPAGHEAVRKRLGHETDIVHLFVVRRARLVDGVRASLAKLTADGAIWVSWPKKASKVETDITEDTIREVALPMGLVDIKACAVDDTWLGLKLVIRKERRN